MSGVVEATSSKRCEQSASSKGQTTRLSANSTWSVDTQAIGRLLIHRKRTINQRRACLVADKAQNTQVKPLNPKERIADAENWNQRIARWPRTRTSFRVDSKASGTIRRGILPQLNQHKLIPVAVAVLNRSHRGTQVSKLMDINVADRFTLPYVHP